MQRPRPRTAPERRAAPDPAALTARTAPTGAQVGSIPCRQRARVGCSARAGAWKGNRYVHHHHVDPARRGRPTAGGPGGRGGGSQPPRRGTRRRPGVRRPRPDVRHRWDHPRRPGRAQHRRRQCRREQSGRRGDRPRRIGQRPLRPGRVVRGVAVRQCQAPGRPRLRPPVGRLRGGSYQRRGRSRAGGRRLRGGPPDPVREPGPRLRRPGPGYDLVRTPGGGPGGGAADRRHVRRGDGRRRHRRRRGPGPLRQPGATGPGVRSRWDHGRRPLRRRRRRLRGEKRVPRRPRKPRRRGTGRRCRLRRSLPARRHVGPQVR